MANGVIMPRQGQSVESCMITKWHKKPGERVTAGEILFSYETDKASFDEEAKASGTLLAVFFEEGDDVPCLSNVAAIGEPGEDVGALGSPAAAAPLQAAIPAQVPAQAGAVTKAQAGDSKFISPRARMLAAQVGLNAREATPTGPNGRVIERDIRTLQAAIPVEVVQTASEEIVVQAAQATAYEDVKLSNIRKVIGKSMMASLSSMAQLTLHTTFDASGLLALRKTFKAAQESMATPNITLNDMLLFAVSRVLNRHRELNAHLLDDVMRCFSGVHLGIAVDTPRGLLVPTLFDADKRSLSEISVQAKTLAKAAQEGSIAPDLLKGGTFTVTNLGTLGVEAFTPVINPPQTGILGVGNMVWRMREVDGELVPYQAMGLSLTFDHRALDGAPAARFLQALTNALENFPALMAK